MRRPILVAVLVAISAVFLVGCDAARSLTEESTTLLHYAADEGDTELVAALLSAGAELEAQDGAGLTPIAVAAEAGRGEVVLDLLEAGADHRVEISGSRSLLHWAAERGLVNVIEPLLAADRAYLAAYAETAAASPDDAASPGAAGEAAEAGEADAGDATEESDEAERTDDGRTEAADDGAADAEPIGVVEGRPLLESIDEDGYTPVDRAAQYEQRDAVLFLVNAGAPVNRVWPRKLSLGGVLLD